MKYEKSKSRRWKKRHSELQRKTAKQIKMRRDIRGKEERVKDTMRMKLENATTEIRKKKECKEIGWVKEKKGK